MGNGIWCFFDWDQYSLSNLRFKAVEIKWCIRNFSWASDCQRTSGHEGTKQPSTIRSSSRTNCEKWFLTMFNPNFLSSCKYKTSASICFQVEKEQIRRWPDKAFGGSFMKQEWRLGWKKLVPIRCVRLLAIFVQARNQNRDHSVAAQPFFPTGDLTLYWDHPGRQRYRSKEFGSMTE